jgi:hypothetical protein
VLNGQLTQIEDIWVPTHKMYPSNFKEEMLDG